MRRPFGVFGLLIALATANSATAAYTIIDLGIDARQSSPGAINDSGVAAFFAYPEGTLDNLETVGVGYLAGPEGVIPLPTVGWYVYVTDINNDGIALGRSGLTSYVFNDGIATEVLSAAHEYLNAAAINDAGQIAGHYAIETGTRGFVWNSVQDVQTISTLGGAKSFAWDINNHGVAVGGSDTGIDDLSAPLQEAFVWHNGVIQGLGTLGGYVSVAYAVNDVGTIVGESSVAGGGHQYHAFVYDEVHGMRDLGRPGEYSVALDVNNAGVIVGWAGAHSTDGESRAIVYSPNGDRSFLDEIVPANSPWQRLLSGNSVNNRGQILGQGLINDEVHVFLATPVPEPSTGALAVVAIALIWLGKRRSDR